MERKRTWGSSYECDASAKTQGGYVMAEERSRSRDSSRISPRLRSAPSCLALALAAGMLASMIRGSEATTAVFLVPVYDWDLIWAESRNDNYNIGGVWRLLAKTTHPGHSCIAFRLWVTMALPAILRF